MENKSIELGMMIESQLIDMIQNDECENYVEISDENITEFFTGIVMASCHLMNQIAGKDEGFLQHTYTLNNLIVQYLIKNKVNKHLK